MFRSLCLCLALVAALAAPGVCQSSGNRTLLPIQEEIWALAIALPSVAYVVHPVGTGPFPLAMMNHGVSLNARERSFFPLAEFRDAAIWLARRDGHFFIDSPDAIPQWSPLVSQILDKHR